ncbi:MAG TPA: hypothetical protein VMZ53_24930 [Kofleriaceae bacterium]|nr:hypothetical protein [Kofleriaceae bacterium]
MKRAFVIVAMMVGAAHAGNAPLVTPPAGWKQDAQQATVLAGKANEVTHFGGLRSLATSDVYVAPEGGAVLIVTAVAGKVTAADRDAAARFAVDELLDASSRATLSGGGITVDSSGSRVVTDAKMVRGDIQWTDKSTGTRTNALVEVVADEENIVAITGECVLGNVDVKLAAACTGALTTLDPGIPLAKRQPIALAPSGTLLKAQPVPTQTMGRPPATMTDGTHTPLPPMTVPTEKPARDLRPVYVGLGIVLLAAAFWWNQRQRAKFEKDSDDE